MRDSSSHLLRDYGISLALLLVSALLIWKTLLPQVGRNRAMDAAYEQERRRHEQSAQELERLEALERAGEDPLVIERLSRNLYRELGLPAQEVLLDLDGSGEN